MDRNPFFIVATAIVLPMFGIFLTAAGVGIGAVTVVIQFDGQIEDSDNSRLATDVSRKMLAIEEQRIALERKNDARDEQRLKMEVEAHQLLKGRQSGDERTAEYDQPEPRQPVRRILRLLLGR